MSSSRAFPGPVSNIIAGPDAPRASKFTTTPIRLISGWRSANACAPRRPVSSPSLIRKMMSLRVVLPEKARASSIKTATPAPSSLTPGPPGTLS